MFTKSQINIGFGLKFLSILLQFSNLQKKRLKPLNIIKSFFGLFTGFWNLRNFLSKIT